VLQVNFGDVFIAGPSPNNTDNIFRQVRNMRIDCSNTTVMVINVLGDGSHNPNSLSIFHLPLVELRGECSSEQILFNLPDLTSRYCIIAPKNSANDTLLPFSILAPKAELIDLFGVSLQGQIIAKSVRIWDTAIVACPLFQASFSCRDES